MARLGFEPGSHANTYISFCNTTLFLRGSSLYIGMGQLNHLFEEGYPYILILQLASLNGYTSQNLPSKLFCHMGTLLRTYEVNFSVISVSLALSVNFRQNSNLKFSVMTCKSSNRH